MTKEYWTKKNLPVPTPRDKSPGRVGSLEIPDYQNFGTGRDFLYFFSKGMLLLQLSCSSTNIMYWGKMGRARQIGCFYRWQNVNHFTLGAISAPDGKGDAIMCWMQKTGWDFRSSWVPGHPEAHTWMGTTADHVQPSLPLDAVHVTDSH